MIQTNMKLVGGVISLQHIDRNEFSFWVIKCHVNATRNEIIQKRNMYLHMRLFHQYKND